MTTDLENAIARMGHAIQRSEKEGVGPMPPVATTLISDLRLILAALSSRAPAGDWVMVPREPTEDMLVAAFKVNVSDTMDFDIQMHRQWAAMLSAAPPPPSGLVSEEVVEKATQTFVDATGDRGEDRWADWPKSWRLRYRDAMRAALLAAGLSSKDGKS